VVDRTTAAHARNAANGTVTYGRFAAAPTRHLSPSDSAGRSQRVRPPHSHRPCGHLASPHIRAAVCQSLAAFSSWHQTCFPARWLRVWHVASALGRRRLGKWLTRSDRERRRAPLRPHNNYVGDLSNRQSAGPGGTLVHRPPQARRRSPVERKGGAVGCPEAVGGEAPAVVYSSVAREEKKREPLTPSVSATLFAAPRSPSHAMPLDLKIRLFWQSGAQANYPYIHSCAVGSLGTVLGTATASMMRKTASTAATVMPSLSL
jgi:hypothetical protein